MRYLFEGFDSTSAVKRGWIEASSKEDASGKLRELKIFAQSIVQEGAKRQDILPDEKATEVNFPDVPVESEAPPEGRIKVFVPTKAGDAEQPHLIDGGAKAHNPFVKQEKEESKMPMDPAAFMVPSGEPSHPHVSGGPVGNAGLPGFSGIMGRPSPATWQDRLKADLDLARQVADAIPPNDFQYDPYKTRNYAFRALVEDAARNAASRIRG